MDPKRIEPHLTLVKHFYQAYREIWVVDLKGRRVSENASGRSYEQEDWFRGAIEREVFISSPGFPKPSLPPTIALSFLIRDRAGRPLGVLKELVETTYLSELISETKLGETGELFLVDAGGRFILHRMFKDLFERGVSGVPYFKGFPERPTYTSVYSDYRNNEVLGTWKWIPSLRCYLIAEQDAKEAFRQTELLVEKASLIFIVSTLLVLALSYWIIGTVTNPIKLLSRTVTSFAEGDFNQTLVTRRKDEIGIRNQCQKFVVQRREKRTVAEKKNDFGFLSHFLKDFWQKVFAVIYENQIRLNRFEIA